MFAAVFSCACSAIGLPGYQIRCLALAVEQPRYRQCFLWSVETIPIISVTCCMPDLILCFSHGKLNNKTVRIKRITNLK